MHTVKLNHECLIRPQLQTMLELHKQKLFAVSAVYFKSANLRGNSLECQERTSINKQGIPQGKKP